MEETRYNWDTMTPEERNMLVHERVMGKPLEVPCTGAITWKPDPFNNKQLGYWVCEFGHHGVKHEAHFVKAAPLPYTQSMDDAWLVVRRVNNPDSPAFPDYQDYARFIDALEEIVGSDCFFDLFYCDKDGDHLTPERLCKAALIAVGVNLE